MYRSNQGREPGLSYIGLISNQTTVECDILYTPTLVWDEGGDNVPIGVIYDADTSNFSKGQYKLKIAVAESGQHAGVVKYLRQEGLAEKGGFENFHYANINWPKFYRFAGFSYQAPDDVFGAHASFIYEDDSVPRVMNVFSELGSRALALATRDFYRMNKSAVYSKTDLLSVPEECVTID